MKIMFRRTVLTVAVFGISFLSFGCATQGVNGFRYVPPGNEKIANEHTSARPYTEVWDGLIKELSKSFFVINNVDKESRIINVSFATNTPGEYVDCGTTYRTYSEGDRVEHYDYETAGPARYKIATPRQPNRNFSYYVEMWRETDLDGRMNIYVAPAEGSKTQTVVTANARYILTTKYGGRPFARHWNGRTMPLYEVIPDRSFKVTFDTQRPGELQHDNQRLTCKTKGTLESQILKMVVQ